MGQCKRIVQKQQARETNYQYDRILDLKKVDVIYSTLMGTCGENGNIMGLADLFKIPMIGCDILASAVSLDKQLSKILANSMNIPIAAYLNANKDDDIDVIISRIEQKIKFPCFVKPVNMGTCAFVFRADTPSEFVRKWKTTIRENTRSDKYLIEQFIPNIEVRVFIYEDLKDRLHTNDEYVTILKKQALEKGGVLFDHLDNELSADIREKIRHYAIKVYRLFQMKDYSRIDFFVDKNTHKIYFNEANTQPFIGSSNVEYMEKDGLSYAGFLDTMIRRNLRIIQ